MASQQFDAGALEVGGKLAAIKSVENLQQWRAEQGEQSGSK